METNHEGQWVTDRLAVLNPIWTADFARGKKLLEEAQTKRTRHWSWIPATAAAAVFAAAIALPQTRAIAQEMWSRWVLNRVDVIRVDFSDLPLHSEVTTGGTPEAVPDIDSAERKAGFRPSLPAAGVLTGTPSMTVIGSIGIEQTVHIADLQSALDKAGAKDVRVPSGWEGVQLRASIGPMVSLGYPGEVGILEAKPIQLSTPAGFPLQRFAEVAFRSIGVGERESQSLAQKFIANPAWLLDIPSDEVVNVEQIPLRAGSALLIQDFNDDGTAGRVTVLRSTKERLYCVLTNDRTLAIRIAEALP